MHKITTIFALLLFALLNNYNVFAQEIHTIDFEDDGIGADWEWTVGENDDNPELEIVENPDQSGANTSMMVAKFTARAAGNPWALFFTSDDGEFTFDENNSTVKLMVHKSRISTVAFKVEGGTGVPTEITATNKVTDEWEELTFDFSSVIGSSYARLVIIPDNAAREEDQIIYIDNIQVPDGIDSNLPTPEEPAPTPTIPEEDVISIYSDVYTDLEGTNFNPGWGQSTAVSEKMIGEDNVLLYEFLNYQGTQLAEAQDVSEMDLLHVDFWTPNSTDLSFFIISVETGEREYPLEIETENWVSVNIPLDYFELQGLDLTDIHQLKVDGNGTVYLDNIYFAKAATSIEENTVSYGTFDLAQNYPNPFSEFTTIRFDILESNNVVLKVHDVYGNELGILVNDYMSAGDHQVYFSAENYSSGTYYLTLTVGNETVTKSMTIVK